MHVRGPNDECRYAIGAAFSPIHNLHGAFIQHYINASLDTSHGAVEIAYGQTTLRRNAINFLLRSSGITNAGSRRSLRAVFGALGAFGAFGALGSLTLGAFGAFGCFAG